MKKVIVILILVVYLASIAVVNIFGKPIGISETNVYIKSIEIVKLSFGDGTVLTEPNGMVTVYDGAGNPIEIPQYQFDFTSVEEYNSQFTDEDMKIDGYTKENALINPNNIFIELRYTTTSPDPNVKADNQVIEIISNDEDEKRSYVFTNERTIVFHGAGTVNLTFRAADGYGAECTIRLRAKK